MVSIVVPIYNAEKTLIRCVESLINQTYKNIEIILVNDGSTDHSAQICKELTEKYQFIKYVEKANGGASSARNMGIENSAGQYIMFIDSDDTVEPRWCESLRTNFDNEEIDLGICNYYCKFRDTSDIFHENAIQEKELFLSGTDLWKIFDINLLHQPFDKMYKRSILEEYHIRFDTSLPIGEDLMFNIEYISKVRRIYLTSERFYCYYYGREDSLSNRFYDNYYEIHKSIYIKLREIYSEMILHNAEWRKQFYLHYYHMAMFALFYVFRNQKIRNKDRILWIDTILQDDEFGRCLGEVEISNKKMERLLRKKKPYLFLLYHYEIRIKEKVYSIVHFRK